ncbi:Leukocyte elastase inhibitor [Papilio xuthus]|uniref:Leukocyte elastase inhibitor n=1 Tax=Papilio xuthus TaxID=66420 RepID=A0A194PMW6_PAPXU|nr:Leukocyte elastase inhibitor [Papilio xuthus]
MHAILWLLLTAAVVCGNETQERRSKLPYIADALGNTLPPPSNLPATVGSPVNLLTPDRYEFYTFDESGELVKRLMTLEEIQAIVAAGEDTEGLVTFANENQPTIAFNFSQPPYTKVHSVVTNVQNVLKAQMEAHKNKPIMRPTLDTPDVSDSWSLILPSIFGNTGLDITPDKTTGSYITPETDTIELDPQFYDDESLSKEGNGQIIVSSTEAAVENELHYTTSTTKTKLTQKTTASTTTSRSPSTTRIPTTKNSFSTTVKPTTTTTRKPISTTSTTTTIEPRPTTTTTIVKLRPPTSATTSVKPKPITTTTTTVRPQSTSTTTTTVKPRPTTTTTTVKPRPTTTTTVKPRSTTTTTVKPRPTTSTTTTTVKPTTKPTLILSSTTVTPISTTVKEITSPSTDKTTEKGTVATDRLQIDSHYEQITERGDIQYEKVSTFIPVSTFTYLPERTTKLPMQATKEDTAQWNGDLKNTFTSVSKSPPTTTSTFDSMSSVNGQDLEKINSTTITTQSISPSTSVTYTQSTSTEQSIIKNNVQQNHANVNGQESTTTVEGEPMGSMFDVAQSMIQIASDLGGAHRPTSSSNDLMESTLSNGVKLESKENLDIDIPSEVENTSKVKIDLNNNTDNYIKISTLDPHDKRENTTTDVTSNDKHTQTTSSPLHASMTTLDPVLSESMGDLLSQVVNEGPDNKFDGENLSENDEKISVTEIPTVVTTEYKENTESTTEVNVNDSNILISSDAPFGSILNIIKNESKINETPIENSEITENKQNLEKVSTINSALSEDKSTLTISVSDINSNMKNDTFQLSSEDKNVPQLNKDDTKSVNSTLPSYKSETEESPEDKNNNFHVSDKNSFDSSKVEEKEFIGIKQNEKVSGTKNPPKTEDFKKKIQKVNIDDKELGSDRNNSWKLIPTVSPTNIHDMKKNPKDKPKTDIYNLPDSNSDKNIILDFSKENQGLELTTKDLSEDIAQFTNLCNELAFRYWNDLVETMDTKRSFVFSPYAVTSMLAMMFMGARGATSGEMNEILKLDDMVTFNPHFTLKNISDSIEMTPASGVAVSAFIRELYSDRNKGKILTFYKERVQHFYNGHVEEVNFKLISDIIRRRTNLLVKRYTWGKIVEFMKTNTIVMQPPLAAFSANIFQTDCFGTSVDGRDGELYFVVSPNVRQRRLVPVPAVVYKNNFLAGYDPTLDATAAALGNINSIVSTIFVMPGQQGNIVHAEDLEELEKRLLGSDSTTDAWDRLLRTLLPRVGLELQIPRFSHKSTFNITSTLQRMGLKDLFDAEHADLGGLNGPSKDLYLSDMIQSNTFVTCGENVVGEQHHIEQYPELQKRRSARWVHGWDEPRDYQRAFHDPHDVGEAMHLPLHLRPRQARLPARNAQPARLKFDRPFLFFVRHNPTGMILYVGRYNPRLLP